ncbi:MAG: PhoH family protein [Kiritimatiellaeota bacterium]|nr:PhoH family protein [Kiritimatiellota bacterium]
MKTYVLDTNVLLHSPESLLLFEDNNVILPMAVIEELDKFKSRHDELGRNAREVIRTLDHLREQGSLRDGVSMDNASDDKPSGNLRIITGHGLIRGTELDMELPDNRIIRVAHSLHKDGDDVIFVSKDINARIKADALGMKVMDFENEKVRGDSLYSGCREIRGSAETIESLRRDGSVEMPEADFLPHEFALLIDEEKPKRSILAKAVSSGTLALLDAKRDRAWGISPRSKEQRVALELLLDPDVMLVTLVGQAGTGKTLLALAAALESVLRGKQFKKILVSRPIMPLGKDIGFLPGDKDEKLFNWMQPIFDNLDYLMHSDKKDSQGVRKAVDDLISNDLLELEALTYIRGRSIPRQYLIVDEAQNLTPHEIKTIISRAGEATKVVLTGDPHQIDNPYLDSESNGLIYAVERLKKLDLHGHITLMKSERSSLAAAAAEYL